jgi:hypothetical protein
MGLNLVTRIVLLKRFVFTGVTYAEGHLDYCEGQQTYTVRRTRPFVDTIIVWTFSLTRLNYFEGRILSSSILNEIKIAGLRAIINYKVYQGT